MAGKKLDLDSERICRACLSEHGHLKNIFSSKLSKMMEACAAIKVSEDDKLPSHVCIDCFQSITRFHAFRIKLELNDKILRNYFKQNSGECKQKDILNIAVSEAQIEINEETSDEDIPLSQRQQRAKPVRSNRNKKGKPEKRHEVVNISDISVVKGETLRLDEEIEGLDVDTLKSLAQFHEPPPLVLLDSDAKKSDGANEIISVIEPLPEDAPPLVPIKPLVIPTGVLTNVVENSITVDLHCNICEQPFDSLSDLKEHRLTNCSDNMLKCNICQKEFKDRKRLIGHLKGHMVVKDYGCKICGKRYPNPSTFQVHMRTHTGERPFKCEICSKGFVRWAGVTGHMRTHQSAKPHICETCGKGFKISSNLERHKVLHMDSLPYCCNYCGKTFSQSDNLQLHIRTYHTNERPYLCNECGKGFVSSTRLNRHLWVHSGYKPYKCKVCPKAYSNSNDLKNHERGHIGIPDDEDKPYACSLCKMKFFHACRLSKHMKTHERPYTCSVCDKSFSTSALLTRHLNSKHSAHGTLVSIEEVGHEGAVNEIIIGY